MAFYNNPDSPPSANNLKTQQKRAQVRKNKGKSKRPGRKKNHPGVSHKNKSEETRRYELHSCKKCGSNNIENTKLKQKQTVVSKVVTKVVTEISCKQHCNDCGHTSDTNDQFEGLQGTMLDKRLAAMSVVQRSKGSSINTIAKSLQCIDNRISNSMVDKAINSSADKLAFLADEIRENNKKSSYIMMDETTLPIDDKKGWVWVLIGDFGVQIAIGPSRGKRFAEDIFGFYQGIPLVCDGYAVYNMFETIQRCWSHVLRHCKAAICDNETRRLYKKLQKLFAHAKKIQAKDQSQVTPKLRQQVQKMIQKTIDIAQEYHKLDNKFGTHLENAAKDLYTFVTHPGMEPTNNASERMLRAIVIFRKICLRLMNEKSMKRFGDLFTCILTWERQGLDVYQKLLEVL